MQSVQSASSVPISAAAASVSTELTTAVAALERTLDVQTEAMNEILALLGVGQNIDVRA